MPLQQPHRADARWNEWRNAKKNALSPGDRWVCVQRVVAAGRGSLGAIDPTAPATAFLVQGDRSWCASILRATRSGASA